MKILRILSLVAMLIGVFSIPVSAQGPPGTWATDITLLNLQNETSTVEIVRYAECTAADCTDAGTVITSTTLAPNGSLYYNPMFDSTFPEGFGGSIVVRSTTDMAGTITIGNDWSGTDSYASDAYSGITDVADFVFLPIVMGQYGGYFWNTRMAIQNAGFETTRVTIHYDGAGAPADTVIDNLPPGMMALVDQQMIPGIDNFIGSATVSSNNGQMLAVVVDEYKRDGGVLVTYVGLTPAQSATTIYMPGYIALSVWQTDFTIVNTTAETATIDIAFSGILNTVHGTIGPNGTAYINGFLGVYPDGWTGIAPSSGYYGAATVQSSEKIVVVYNEANSGAGGIGNFSLGYVALSAAAGSKTVAVPLVMRRYTTGWDTTYSIQVIDDGSGGQNRTRLSMVYSGNMPANCNPCTTEVVDSATLNMTDITLDHVPEGYIGGVVITSLDRDIVVVGDQNKSIGAVGDTAAGYPGIKIAP